MVSGFLGDAMLGGMVRVDLTAVDQRLPNPQESSPGRVGSKKPRLRFQGTRVS